MTARHLAAILGLALATLAVLDLRAQRLTSRALDELRVAQGLLQRDLAASAAAQAARLAEPVRAASSVPPAPATCPAAAAPIPEPEVAPPPAGATAGHGAGEQAEALVESALRAGRLDDESARQLRAAAAADPAAAVAYTALRQRLAAAYNRGELRPPDDPQLALP